MPSTNKYYILHTFINKTESLIIYILGMGMRERRKTICTLWLVIILMYASIINNVSTESQSHN